MKNTIQSRVDQALQRCLLVLADAKAFHEACGEGARLLEPILDEVVSRPVVKAHRGDVQAYESVLTVDEVYQHFEELMNDYFFLWFVKFSLAWDYDELSRIRTRVET